MKYPKMIIFDYGHTLLYEPSWDSVRGNAELLKYATKNPNNCTLADVRKAAKLIFFGNTANISDSIKAGRLRQLYFISYTFKVKLELKYNVPQYQP